MTTKPEAMSEESERDELQGVSPLSRDQITPEIADQARKAVASHTVGMGHSILATAGIYAAYTIIRERQILQLQRDKRAADLLKNTALRSHQEWRKRALEAEAALAAANQRADEAFNAMPKQLVSDKSLEGEIWAFDERRFHTTIALLKELQAWRKWAKERPTGKAGE